MENKVQAGLKRVSMRSGWIALIAVLWLAAACGGDTTNGTVPVVDAGVDTKPPKTPLPSPCVLKLNSPVKGQHVNGVLQIEGTATHLSLGMNSAEAGLSPLFDDGSNPTSVIIGSKSNEDWTDETFAWDFDVSSLATGEWALVVKAWADPNPEYPSQSQGSCSIQMTIFVDNKCPINEVEVPKDGVMGGNYFQTMPVNIKVDDDTGIQSAHIENDEGEVLYDFELNNDGFGEQTLNTVLDVCLYGTGVVAFNLVLTDQLDNTCTHSLLPNVIRCPQFSGVHESFLPEDVTAKQIVRADLDGDGRKDIVAATDAGIVWFRNDAEGVLEDGAIVPDILGTVSIVQPVDLNGDNKVDLIVAETSGSKSKIRIFLAGNICKPDPEWDPGTTETDILKGVLYPTVCADGYGLAQEFSLPAAVSAHLLYNVAVDPDVVGASIPTKDFVVGTHADSHALMLLMGVEGTNNISGANGAPWCTWWQPTWNGMGEELPQPEYAVSKCFRAPKVFPSVGGINSLAAADYVEDENNAVDLIATRGDQGLLTVYKNDGEANFKTPYSIFLPAPATQVIPQLFNIEEGGVTTQQHMDAMFIIPSIGQIWTIYGDGTGNWLTATDQYTGMDYVARRVTCVEGEPTSLVMDYLDEAAGAGAATLDLLVTNKTHGTLMTYAGGSLNQATGTRFDVGSIVDTVTEPKQVLLNYVNDDVYHDAVVLRGDGQAIGVVYGADPSKPGTDPDYGPLGTFVGVNHIPTVIPEQPLGAYHVCDVTKQPAVSGQPFLGTADERLAPAFMAVGDFINDVQNRPDLVIVTEMSHSTLDDCDPVSLECPPRQPILTYRWDNKYQLPNALAQVSESIPYFSFCVNGEDECEEDEYGEKSDTSSMAMGNFDFKSGPDLVITTLTSSPRGDDLPELPTIEVLENDKNGIPHQGAFKQYTKATDNHELFDLPGLWTDYGIHAGSTPVSVAALHCQGVFSDPLTDFAVLASLETDTNVWPQLSIMQSKGNSYQRFGDIEYFDPGQKSVVVRAGLFGSATAVGGEDTISDLVAVTSKAVYVYEGQPNCIFERIAQLAVGSDPQWVAVGDLNDDTFAELVVPVGDGSLTVAYGIDGSYWTSPVKIVPEGDVGFSQVEIADLNGDGYPDVAAFAAEEDLLYIYVNNGYGEMNKVLPYIQKLTAGTSSFAVTDINENQCLDLFALSPGAKGIGVFRNRATLLGGCVHINTVTP